MENKSPLDRKVLRGKSISLLKRNSFTVEIYSRQKTGYGLAIRILDEDKINIG